MSLVLSSYRSGAAARGYDCTGATGTTGCSNGGGCHNAVTTAGTTVELDSAGIPVTSYHPGGAYTVKISATCGTAGTLLPLADFGFQLATVSSTGAGSVAATQLGTWGSLPANVVSTAASGRRTFPIIEQSAAIAATSGTGAVGTIYSISIPWTAPVSGSGPVEIFGIINEVTGLDVNSFCNYQAATPIIIPQDTGQGSGHNTGVNYLSANLSSFTAFPTLMNTNVTLAFDLNATSSVKATLISIGGQEVRAFMSGEQVGAGSFKRTFDVDGLATGVYLLRVEAGGESVVTKVVKE